jgi:hypothetical protein
VAYYRVAEARDAFYRTAGRQADFRTAESMVKSAAKAAPGQTFDIFLSHSFRDSILIQGVKTLLEEQGRTVYIDWIDDPQLDRSKVTKNTAKQLRDRMRSCSSLIYVKTSAASSSLWMPWELGYFDGLRGQRIAVMPLVENRDSEYVGQEYLGIYPVMEKLESRGGEMLPYVRKSYGSSDYKTLEGFAQGVQYRTA